jgi:hypothetical protein
MNDYYQSLVYMLECSGLITHDEASKARIEANLPNSPKCVACSLYDFFKLFGINDNEIFKPTTQNVVYTEKALSKAEYVVRVVEMLLGEEAAHRTALRLYLLPLQYKSYGYKFEKSYKA